MEIKHIRCNMEDFYADRHRFRVIYEGNEYIATCYHNCNVMVDNGFPLNMKYELSELIWKEIDKKQYRWKYPKQAYEIANRYCEEEFGQNEYFKGGKANGN